MKGFSYLDQVNMRIVDVTLRYPEDLEYCTGRPTVDDLNSYLDKHPDEREYLIGVHDLKKRLFREQANDAKVYQIANSKSFIPKPCKDESFEAHLKELNNG